MHRDGVEEQAAAELKAHALEKAVAGGADPPLTASADVLQQLQEIREIDPAAEQQLLADLKEANPENHAMMVNTFRTALAYRQQLADRERTAFAGETPENEFDVATQQMRRNSPPTQPKIQRVSAAVDGTQDVDQADHAHHEAAPSPAAANWPPSQSPQAAITADPQVSPAAHQAPAGVPPAVDAIHPQTPAAVRSMPPAAISSLPATPNEPDEPDAADVAIASDDQPLPLPTAAVAALPNSTPQQPLTPIVADAAPGDWHAQLNATIADLQQTVAPQPTTVAELHDHMRLRTLQLLAGNEKEAYSPIPGASPAQQDFWSKQLFAISAYLSATTQLDEKQRAIAALAPLDEARSRLSELASLRVRNITFVDKVDGFGAYEPSKVTTFRPGQKVMLYAEVENFTSNASEQGYATSLGTSFKVLNESGRLVDGKQFPDVQDQCRNRRRDFHMQYELALPERIYPGPYEIELTITDHNSGKLGQATISFEIADDAPQANVAAAPAASAKK
ncbi:hypothetical protein PLANPX_4543 [Lacipirellula parvula]|uniref:Uncharacterized protein n=2 Tax=Lacipirellula parvula TaxID=2650471 RepID=A0A5K7XIX3_9BACT|nr:hypothetical protein PLANPX_4543 [Lacipirellula parvula]